VTHIVVLADTHVGPHSNRQIPAAAYRHFDRADLVLHAGDLVMAEVLHELEGFAPVHAVLGNNDHDLFGVLPERVELEVDGVRFGIVHDSGETQGRAARMARWFPDADVVVFGHSHMPCAEVGVAGQLLFNPGSSTWKRRAPSHTIGLIDLDEGRLVSHQIVVVD